MEAKKEKSKDALRRPDAPRPVGTVGGGRGGSLIAFAEATGSVR